MDGNDEAPASPPIDWASVDAAEAAPAKGATPEPGRVRPAAEPPSAAPGPGPTPGPTPGPASGYRRLRPVPALDGLRGIAVLLIFLAHTEEIFLLSWVIQSHGNGFLQGGVLGVDLFFVLSGFLITALLLREQAEHGRARLGSFYARRALRLLPALFALLAVQAIYAVVTHLPKDIEVSTIVAAVFYYLNWYWAAGNTVAAGLSNLWSLSVEEQFYLVWPALLFLFFGLRRRVATVTAVLVIAIAVVFVHRIMLWNDGASIIAIFVRTDTRADSLLIGVLLAQLWVRRRTPTRGLGIAAWIGALVFFLCVAFTRAATGILFPPKNAFLYLGGFTVVALAGAAVILATVEGRWSGSRLLSWSPLRAVGRVSYGLYLWHLAVFTAVARYCSHWPVVPEIGFAWALSAAFTIASWNVVERPFRSWKNRLGPARPADAQPVALG
jgi:peptidoglycan/LPS O-acetylase OafA/YrhL